MGERLDPIARRFRWDSDLWRRAMLAGIHHGPTAWLRYSPPVFGVAFGALLRQKRRSAERTLRQLTGPQPRWRRMGEVAKVFSTYASCMTDAMLLGAERGYKPMVRSANQGAHFKQCQELGHGIILATAHTAGWDVAGPLLSTLQSNEIIVVMERERDARARRLSDQVRERAGVRIVHAGDDPLAALPLLRHLRRGGIVAMKFDRTVPGMRCRDVHFLGESSKIPEGILKLAALSGAPILPVFTKRLGFLEYEYVTAEPMRLPRRPSEAELDATAQGLATELERFARGNPEQWFRFAEPEMHDVAATGPPDAPIPGALRRHS
jgi:KDO2-lipid IV(A) lauroyltransferase